MEITYINLSRNRYGGRIFEDQMIETLQEKYTVREINLIRFKKILLLNIPWILYVWIKFKFFYSGTLLITGILSSFRGARAKKNFVIVHHIDYRNSPFFSYWLQRVNFGYLLANPYKFDMVIVVSEFWKKELLKYNFENVQILYNAFDPSVFKISDDAVTAFRLKYNVQDKPIIYLGNGQKKKGADLAYEKLKDMNVHFVITGAKDIEVPIRHLQLDYQEYLCLLKASKVVVLMSELLEGWNRIAHEAILCGTPVVGSGKGGMREVLESANQTICENPDQLYACVDAALLSKVQPGFLKSLDLVYFEQRAKELFKPVR